MQSLQTVTHKSIRVNLMTLNWQQKYSTLKGIQTSIVDIEGERANKDAKEL